MRPRRALLLAALALCVPLPALAVGGDKPPSAAPATLAVGVALDRCGILEARILCKLDVRFDSVPGASSYTASVTRPDGSVVDLGEIGAGPASAWVAYAGDGTYTVEVSAYGDPEEPGGEPELLGRDRAAAGGPDGAVEGAVADERVAEGDSDLAGEDPDDPDGGGEGGVAPEPPPCDAGATADDDAGVGTGGAGEGAGPGGHADPLAGASAGADGHRDAQAAASAGSADASAGAPAPTDVPGAEDCAPPGDAP